jgi:hypothetical protein
VNQPSSSPGPSAQHRTRRWLSLVVALCCISRVAAAKEVDQLTDRVAVLNYYAGGYRQIAGALGPEQVAAALDAEMNRLLDQLRDRLNEDPPLEEAQRNELVRKTFQHRYVPELITPYEEWVDYESRLPLYIVRDKGIYGHAIHYDDMRMIWYIDLSPVIMAGGVLIGTDKLGHFLAQGFQYFERYQQLRGSNEAVRLAAIRAFGHAQEIGQLGLATGAIYSFADLASNWDGMLFFLALFDDVSVEGQSHARYFTRDDRGGFVRTRDFHWSEWVTPDWDEVLNPTHTEGRALYDKIVANSWRSPAGRTSHRPSVCESYLQNPAAYLGTRRELRPRSRYVPETKAMAAAPFALDIRVMCRPITTRSDWTPRTP